MLHSKKSQAILQWYNSLTTKGDVNSLEQFTDGSHFYEIVASLQPFLLQEIEESDVAPEAVILSETSIACNEEVITSVEEDAVEKMETSVSENVDADPFVIKETVHTDTYKKYDVIRKFIDGFYHMESSLLIDYGECQKGKELELAKVAVFLLSAWVQYLVSSNKDIVYTTTCLDFEIQENIHECLILALDEKGSGENQIKKSDLHKVLSRAASYKGTPVRKSSRSTSDPNEMSEGVKKITKKRKERTSFIADQDPQNSPLKSFLESPKVQCKAAILKKESELAKLRGALHWEENKVMDLTLEKKNLNDELEKQKKELEFYKKELQSYREALSEKENQEKLKTEELKDKKMEAEKVRKLIESQEEEIKELKKNNEALQEKVVDIEKKLKQDGASSLIKENNNLKDKIQILEYNNEEKAETIKILSEKIASLESDLNNYKEHSTSNNRREMTGSPNVSETLSTIIYADEQSRETLERKEQELGPDMELKDRVKRLPRKRETPKCCGNICQNVEFVQAQLDQLKRENDSLKLRLAEVPDASSSSSPTSTSQFNQRTLNSIKKEDDGIGSQNYEDKKMNCQLNACYTEEPHLSSRDLEDGQLFYVKGALEQIIIQLLRKKFILKPTAVGLIEQCQNITNPHQFAMCLGSLASSLKPQESVIQTRRSSSRVTSGGVDQNSLIQQVAKLEEENYRLISELKTVQLHSAEQELRTEVERLKASNKEYLKENENLKQEVAIAQEKYVSMEKLAKKKDDDVKKALIMYQKIVKLDKKEKDSKKECGEECEKLRRRCKQLNEECLDFEQRAADSKRRIKHLEWMMENLKFNVKELEKEKKELRQKLWEETSALSKNTTDRDALVLHYLKKSKHEPKKNKDIELEKEEIKKSSRPIVKVDAYILNAENEQSLSNSILASRSIRSSYFQVADEDDFLNESSLAEIHNGGILEGESGENRLLELQRRNTLCPPHLQSSYPLEIQNMTPSERKYYNPEMSSNPDRKSSVHNEKRDTYKKKSKSRESDDEDSDDSHSFPVKKRKISVADSTSVPASKKHYRPSSCVAKVPLREQVVSRKPSTPLKKVVAYVKRQSSTFRTPSSVHRLMTMQRKSKKH